MPDPDCPGHEWRVLMTASDEDGILLELFCDECGLFGTVHDPNAEEWAKHAMSLADDWEPLEWLGGDWRVREHPEHPRMPDYFFDMSPVEPEEN
jgi:hypothetical protein